MPFRVLAAICGRIRAGGGPPTLTIFQMDNLGLFHPENFAMK